MSSLSLSLRTYISGWPRFGSWRFRFVPVRFINGSVRERFVLDRFGSVRFLRSRGSVRFGCEVVRFMAVHDMNKPVRFGSSMVSVRFGSVLFFIMFGGSGRFIAVHGSVRFVDAQFDKS